MITHNVKNVFTALMIDRREQTQWWCYIVLFVAQQIETLHIETYSCDYSVLVYKCKTEQGHTDKSLTASWAAQRWSDLRLEAIFRAAQRWDTYSLTFDLWVELSLNSLYEVYWWSEYIQT